MIVSQLCICVKPNAETIDKCATEDTRLLDFNVEALCTPNRSATIGGLKPTLKEHDNESPFRR
jgi:hypothetical protein